MTGNRTTEFSGICPIVRKYRRAIVLPIGKVTAPVPLAPTVCPGKLSGHSLRQELRNSLQESPSRVKTYETQDHHTRRYDRPHAGRFQAGSGSATLCRSLHWRGFICFESLVPP